MICPNCKVQIPDDSKFCPECGQPVNGKKPKKKYELAIMLFIAFLFGCLFMKMITPTPSASTKDTKKIETTQNEKVTDQKRAESKTAGAEEVSMNTPFSVPDKAEVTIQDVSFNQELMGRFSGYKADDGKTLIQVKTTIKNLEKNRIDEDKAPKVSILYDTGYEYKCLGAIRKKDSVDGFFMLESLTSNTIIYWANVDPSMANDGKAIKIKVQIGDKTFLCNYR